MTFILEEATENHTTLDLVCIHPHTTHILMSDCRLIAMRLSHQSHFCHLSDPIWQEASAAWWLLSWTPQPSIRAAEWLLESVKCHFEAMSWMIMTHYHRPIILLKYTKDCDLQIYIVLCKTRWLAITQGAEICYCTAIQAKGELNSYTSITWQNSQMFLLLLVDFNFHFNNV